MEYARSIHWEYAQTAKLTKDKQYHYRIARQKKMLIDTLKDGKKNQKHIIRVLNRWINIHQLWFVYLSYLKKNHLSKYKTEARKNGALSWHKRWNKVYKEAINVLK